MIHTNTFLLTYPTFMLLLLLVLVLVCLNNIKIAKTSAFSLASLEGEGIMSDLRFEHLLKCLLKIRCRKHLYFH